MKIEEKKKASILGLLAAIIYFLILFVISPIPFIKIENSDIISFDFLSKMIIGTVTYIAIFSIFLLLTFALANVIKCGLNS
ncbi:hypothetical protein ACI1TW_09805 [Lactococcus garvieae]|uniref:hypothetical protein n=1 Tax=Lactococcus garvieae TaxID=1363 RepID=UPI00385417D6